MEKREMFHNAIKGLLIGYSIGMLLGFLGYAITGEFRWEDLDAAIICAGIFAVLDRMGKVDG